MAAAMAMNKRMNDLPVCRSLSLKQPSRQDRESSQSSWSGARGRAPGAGRSTRLHCVTGACARQAVMGTSGEGRVKGVHCCMR